jgi:hypothetical protein
MKADEREQNIFDVAQLIRDYTGWAENLCGSRQSE